MEKIGDYLLIGDLHTSALVSKKGSIDWLCFPHFDSPSVFAKILDNKKGGEFSFDVQGYKVKSEYEEKTAIVKTEFTKKNKKFIVKDFMVPETKEKTHKHVLIRKITSKKGNHDIKLIYRPSPNYGKKKPEFKKEKNYIFTSIDKKNNLILHIPEDIVLKKNDGCEIEFKLKEGETKEFILEYCSGFKPLGKHNFEEKTRKFWKKWISKGNFFRFCKDKMIRSAITLKLMQFYPTGALIASPTTSLPEAIKGNRNWDYRFVWIRDATFALYAFYILGYNEEARNFFKFIESIAKKSRKKRFKLNLLYTIFGKKAKKERKLSWLSGYKESKPVRVGNSASEQFQLDVYGALIDSYYFMSKRGFRLTRNEKRIARSILREIKENWMREDHGIWEFRDKKENYTYSKVMAWVGINRAIRISDILGIKEKEKNDLRKIENEIRDWIWRNCYSGQKEKLVQFPGSRFQDSTNLLFVLLQFLDKKDPITGKIIEKTRKEIAKGHFVYRYKRKDGFKGEEGAFLLCSSWMISALAIMERVDEAEKLFNEFEKMMNSPYLLAEEMDPKTEKFLGNYPQAFSHMGYIMSAYYIDKYRKKLKKKGLKNRKK